MGTNMDSAVDEDISSQAENVEKKKFAHAEGAMKKRRKGEPRSLNSSTGESTY